MFIYGLTWWLSGKESLCWCRRCGFIPWVGKIPWRRKWQPTLVFLPGKSVDREALQATDHGITKSRTWLSDWTTANVYISDEETRWRGDDFKVGTIREGCLPSVLTHQEPEGMRAVEGCRGEAIIEQAEGLQGQTEDNQDTSPDNCSLGEGSHPFWVLFPHL